MADQPPLPDTPLMRHDMQAMLSFIQGARIVSMARETAVSRVQGWLLRRYGHSLASAAAMLALIFLIGLFPAVSPHRAFLCGIVLLLLVARIGALISIGRRIKDDDVTASVDADAIYALATLGSGINGLAIALMSSNAFGLVMYALFASGLPATLGLSGGIAPKFELTIGELHTRMLTAQEEEKVAHDIAGACTRSSAPTPVASDAADSGEDASTNTADTGAEPEPVSSDNAAVASPSPAVSPPPTPTPPPPTPTATATTQPEQRCAELTRKADLARDEATVAADAFHRAVNIPPAKAGSAAGAEPDTILSALKYGLGLAEVSDLFKLLIWAFIAGFFETLVPDMLDALAKRGQKQKDQK